MIQDFPVQLIYNDQPFILNSFKTVKNFRLRYDHKQRQFCVTVPNFTTKKEVEGFLHRAEPWLNQKITHYKEEVVLTHGARVPLLGETHYIYYQKCSKQEAFFTDNAIIISSPKENWEKILRKALREKALDFFKEESLKYAKLLNVSVGKITIRDIYSRWGSCSADGNLSYNWRLIFAPREVVQYICAHEVSHRRFMDHTKSFWHTVASICPNYKQHYSWLKEDGRQLFKYRFLEE